MSYTEERTMESLWTHSSNQNI